MHAGTISYLNDSSCIGILCIHTILLLCLGFILSRDINDLHDINTNLNQMVVKQGDVVDNIGIIIASPILF